MIIPSAYLIYRFFTRFPLAVIVVFLSHNCFSSSVYHEVETVKSVELYVTASDAVLDNDKLNSSFTFITSNRKNIWGNQFIVSDYESPFKTSQFYDLYLLYSKILIDQIVLV